MAETPSRTAWMNAVLAAEDETIDSLTIAVACVLQRHMNAALACHPSTRRVAAMARCSRNAAMDRISRLEKAGLLVVERRQKAVSSFQACLPPGEPVQTSGALGEPPGSPPEPDHLAHPESQNGQSGSSESESGSPRGHRSTEGTNSSSSPTQTTHARPKRHWEPRTEPAYTKGQKVTRPLLWRMMAWRRLELDRELGRDNLPPAGSYREVRLLETLEADFETQFNERALKNQGRLPGNDLERWIYDLVPELAHCGWGPILAAGNAQHAKWKAESDARMANVTDEDRQANVQALRELRERIQNRHLHVVAHSQEATPA